MRYKYTMSLYAQVAVKCPLNRLFTYSIPSKLEPKIKSGMRVDVPWRGKVKLGYVISLIDELKSDISKEQVRPINKALDESPVFSEGILKLICWISHYYCSPIGEVCRSALPNRLNGLNHPKTTRPILPEDLTPRKNTKKEFRLTEEQMKIVSSIGDDIKDFKNRVHLIHGITGSGKTEVYLELFAKNMEMKRDGICLVPEIALTPQLSSRFYEKFGDSIAIYHSNLTEAQSHEQWERIRGGKVSIVIGTRSAIFAPFQNLGLIIVDEEHDSSYKQSNKVPYQARDAAIMRARIEETVAVLGSATPSIESFTNCSRKKYIYHSLKQRPLGASLPKIEIIDLRNPDASSSSPSPSSTLSSTLMTAIEERLKRKEQSLIFLNRRGFANYLLCKKCGFIARCPNCQISLTYHKKINRLSCHYCDYSSSTLKSCPSCNSPSFANRGSGTEKIEEEISKTFPSASVVRLDSDSIQNPRSRSKILNDMKLGKIDILVGTQIITKGHDFSNLTLVGIVDADMQLNFPDFRSSEQTFQMITQVAGRAGRAQKEGTVLIQTMNPDHYALKFALAHDYEGFLSEEMKIREELCYPPFSRIINLCLSGEAANTVKTTSLSIKKILEGILPREDFKMLGPAPAPLNILRGKFRWQIMIKTPSATRFADIIYKNQVKLQKAIPHKITMTIDVDPVDML